MPVTVSATGAFDEWLSSLSQRERKEVQRSVGMLRELGLQLSYPYSSAIKGSRFPLRELRPKRGDSPLRVIYCFDPRREALLIIGGHKGADKRMYERIIPVAEELWEQHLKDIEDEEEDHTP